VSLLYTHNGEQCLREQIENVLQQSRTPECVLILDDGSNDHSVAIAESFAKSDERIRFIRDETNLGYVRTFVLYFKWLWFPDGNLYDFVGGASMLRPDSDGL
jgi:glycosyltransferase involved in cell wall biosynthesis